MDRSGLPSPKVRKTPNENSEIISNVLSGFAVYMGLKIAVQPPDEDHPYGHGKGEPFAAAAPPLAVVLVVLGADAKRSLIIKTKIVELFIMLAGNQPSQGRLFLDVHTIGGKITNFMVQVARLQTYQPEPD